MYKIMKELTEKQYLAALWKIPELRLDLYKKLFAQFASGRKIWEADIAALLRAGVTPLMAGKIAEGRRKINPQKVLAEIEQEGIRVIEFSEPDYPDNLKSLIDSPPVLFVKGELQPRDALAIAVVGTRKASNAGLSASRWLAREMAKAGLTVVSGLARGVDAAAHWGALEAGGRTIAVLGCGVDVVYPPEHVRLKAEIEKQGAVVSEFPPGTPPYAWNFPARNRIISGLSLGVVVAEAGEKSGALITADFALEQGREVFAIPGNIRNDSGKGSNLLLKQGAKIVSGVEDILEELNLENLASSSESGEPNLSGMEERILNALDADGVEIENLIEATGLASAELLPVLFKLESRGWVERCPGNIYLKVKGKA